MYIKSIFGDEEQEDISRRYRLFQSGAESITSLCTCSTFPSCIPRIYQ